MSDSRRILLALDASPGSLKAAEAAAELAAAEEAELSGLFVEDARVLHLAGGAAAIHADLTSRTLRPAEVSGLERELRAQASRARDALERIARRTGIPWSFRTARGHVEAEILAAAGADLVALGRVGWSRGWGELLGSTARALLEATGGGAALLRPRSGRPPGRSVSVLFEASGPGRVALAVASRLVRNGDPPLRVLVRHRETEGSEEALAGLAERGRKAVSQVIAPGQSAARTHAGAGALLLPLSGVPLDENDLRELLEHLDFALLLVAAPAP